MAKLNTQNELKTKEMLRHVLPNSVDLLTSTVRCLLEADERKAAEKVLEHFFITSKERKAFMELVTRKSMMPGTLSSIKTIYDHIKKRDDFEKRIAARAATHVENAPEVC
jgi:hypothetical protein